jgi:hypothetical protein
VDERDLPAVVLGKENFPVKVPVFGLIVVNVTADGFEAIRTEFVVAATPTLESTASATTFTGKDFSVMVNLAFGLPATDAPAPKNIFPLAGAE